MRQFRKTFFSRKEERKGTWGGSAEAVPRRGSHSGYGYKELWKGGNLDVPEWGGIGREMRLELKLGTSTGKECTHGVLGKMDERMSEMKGREIES